VQSPGQARARGSRYRRARSSTDATVEFSAPKSSRWTPPSASLGVPLLGRPWGQRRLVRVALLLGLWMKWSRYEIADRLQPAGLRRANGKPIGGALSKCSKDKPKRRTDGYVAAWALGPRLTHAHTP
jgi:hypothetical protein